VSVRKGRPFYPIENSTAPAFNSSSLNTAFRYVLESTERVWQGPSNRAVRVVGANSSAAYYLKLGSSTVVAASSDSFLSIGAYPTVMLASPSQTYISLVSSTNVIVNVTLGYAG